MPKNKAAKAAPKSVENNHKATRTGGITGKGFQPGQSGNPGGRKKVAPEVKEMLKAEAPEAARFLIETMHNEAVKDELRIKCAETVLERVYGKATQPIEGDLSGGFIITIGQEVADYAG